MKHSNLVNAILAAGHVISSDDPIDFMVRNGQALVSWRAIGSDVVFLEACYHDSNSSYNFTVEKKAPKSIKEVVQFLDSGNQEPDRVKQALAGYRDDLYEEFYDKANDFYYFTLRFMHEYQMSNERKQRLVEAIKPIEKIIKHVGRICVEQDKEDEKNGN